MIRKIFPTITNKILIPHMANKTVIITGGATGLGKKMAEHFASNDVNTIICSRNEDRLKETTQHINNIVKKDLVSWYPVDVADLNSVNNFYEKLNEKNINPDILINNAAGNFVSRTEDLSPNAINRIIDIVLKGTINMSIPFSKNIMNQDKFGSVLSISTLYANTGSGFVVPSSIAKAGVNNMTKSLASEWAKFGIRFNAIAPGSIYTEGAFSRLDPTGDFKKLLVNSVPCGRLGDPAELANLALYLSSDYSSWFNGQIINLDGGEGNFRSGQMNEFNNLSNDFWNHIKRK